MIQSKTRPAPAALLPAVIEVVRQAGALIRKEFHRPGGPRGEGSHAPIDKEVEVIIKRQLLALHLCSWSGEETGNDVDRSDDTWIVDPNDGTRDFILGRRGSAVSVALVRQGRPVLGVVYAPVAPDDRGDLVAWAEGTALTRNSSPVSRKQPGAQPIIALNADAPHDALHNHRSLPGMRVRAIPSVAYRLALAAVGEVDAAVSLVPGLVSWDIAGGHALLIGAGNILVDKDGKDISYRGRTVDGCVGGPAALVSKIVGLNLKKVRGERKQVRHSAQPQTRISDPELLSRAQGCLLGQLAGDALGSAVEFQSAREIALAYPNGVRDLADGGHWKLIAGQPTDDSEMALALARELVRRGRFDEAGVADAYVAWKKSQPFDIGTTTICGIRALAAGRRSTSDSESNGALMRVSPIGIFSAGDPGKAAQLAAEDARLTHPHPICQAASAAYAAAIAVGLQGADADGMWSAAYEHAGEGSAAAAIRERLVAARTKGPENFEGHQKGWVLIAFQNAFHWLMRGTGVDEAIMATVAKGGDTDTNAAICGALLGAAQGRDALPLQWRNAVLSCRPVQATEVIHPRPQEYWPDDALDLAEALVTAGSVAPHRSLNPIGAIMSNVVNLKPTVTFTAEIDAETAALVDRFVAVNQHIKSTHGPMSREKLVRMLLEDIAAAMRDSDTWQGAHMALVISEHGYGTG